MKPVLAIAGTSLSLLIGALAFQYVGGLAPCTLCMWQRYAHLIVLGACVAALLRPTKLFRLTGAASSVGAAAVAGFHVGVEQGWWEGLKTCSGSVEDLAGMTAASLLDFSAQVSGPACSDIAWSMLGISMAGWNMLITLGAGALWFAPLRARN